MALIAVHELSVVVVASGKWLWSWRSKCVCVCEFTRRGDVLTCPSAAIHHGFSRPCEKWPQCASRMCSMKLPVCVYCVDGGLNIHRCSTKCTKLVPVVVVPAL